MSSSGVNPRYHLMHAIGFRNADISWLWIWSSVVGFVAHKWSSKVRAFLKYPVEEACRTNKPWKIFATKFWPSRVDELIWSCVMIYVFRNVERKFGSKKYANFLLIVLAASGCLELAVLRVWKNFQHLPFSEVAVGLYSPLSSCFVAHVATSPGPVSENEVFQRYFFGCYALLVLLRPSYHAAVFSALSGLIAGLFYISNVLSMQRWTILPDRLVKMVSKLKIGSLTPREGPSHLMPPIGATESAQTEQLYEWWENRRLVRQDDNNNVNVQPFTISGRWLRRFFPAIQRAESRFSQADDARTDEERIQMLMDMGFSNRELVVQVLRSVNNDLNVAALALSQQVDG